MKKILSASLLIIQGMFIQVYPQTILFQDDFENYSVGTFPAENWILCYEGTGTQNQVVVDDEWVSPNQSLRLENAPNWAANAHRILSQTPPVIYCEVSMMVKAAGHGGYISFKNPDIGTWGTYYANVWFSPDGTIKCNDIDLQEIEINVWYHIKMMYDSQKDLCNVWINGELKGSNIPCYSDGDYSAFCIQAYHANFTSRVWFDDVIVYADLLPPTISSIKDVPDDHGKQVMITWDRSNLDIPSISNPIMNYTVWRFDEVLTYITGVPAMQMEHYAVTATTLFDSCSSGCNYARFQVVAHTSDPWVYLVSAPDSGYSVDNSSMAFAVRESQVNNFDFKLLPNPAEEEVAVSIVSWQLAVGQNVRLTMLDLLGREVRTILTEMKSGGECTLRLNVSDLPPGVYLVRFQSGGQSAVKKMMVN